LILFLTDQELDKESGLYNYDARLYDSIAGAFVSADTVVPDWFDSQSFNRFAYCRNNPLKYKDPTGHWFVIDDAFTGPVDELAVAGLLGIAAYGFGSKAAQDALNYMAGKAKDLMSSNSTPKSNPFTGSPEQVQNLDTDDGTPKQDRKYGPDGYPETDIDYDHDHGQGQPHAHDWDRPEDGSPPTHKDRSRGRPLSDEEKKNDRSSAPQKTETESQGGEGEQSQEGQNQGGDSGDQKK
jgi:RHS repeat-associated protein